MLYNSTAVISSIAIHDASMSTTPTPPPPPSCAVHLFGCFDYNSRSPFTGKHTTLCFESLMWTTTGAQSTTMDSRTRCGASFYSYSYVLLFVDMLDRHRPIYAVDTYNTSAVMTCTIQLRKPDHVDHTAPTRQRELDHIDQELICPERSGSSSRDR